MKHNNSSGAARADTWCWAYRSVESRPRPQSDCPAPSTAGRRSPSPRPAPTSGWWHAESRRTAEACRRTSPSSSCSRHGSRAPSTHRRRLANARRDDRRAEKDCGRISRSPLPAHRRAGAFAMRFGCWIVEGKVLLFNLKSISRARVGVEEFSFLR